MGFTVFLPKSTLSEILALAFNLGGRSYVMLVILACQEQKNQKMVCLGTVVSLSSRDTRKFAEEEPRKEVVAHQIHHDTSI